MTTAVDTNILVDVMGGDPVHARASANALSACVLAGAVVVSDVVWAETAAGFADLDRFREAMRRLGVAFVPMEPASAEAASAAWRRYRADGGSRARIVADFLIGAHAELQADRLLTRDRGFFRRYFGNVPLVDPTS